MADYSKIAHLKDLNNSMFNERMNRAYDYGYEDGLARGTECGYKRGYENGQKSIEKCAEKITYKDIHDAYQRGLDDAWECARKIYNMTAEETIRVFGGCSNWINYSALEAIAKIREYDQDKLKKDYHKEDWWENLGYDIEQLAEDWGCTIECIAEKANQLWEEKGESE